MPLISDEPALSSSPPQYGRIARLRGFLPLSEDSSPMVTHGQGTLTSLLRTRSVASLHTIHRRPSSLRGRDDEDIGPFERYRRNSTSFDDLDDHRRSDERRLETILNGPQVVISQVVPSLFCPRTVQKRFNSFGELSLSSSIHVLSIYTSN